MRHIFLSNTYLFSFTAVAFQQGKLSNNPFQGGAPAPGAVPGGAMVPPPANMGGMYESNWKKTTMVKRVHPNESLDMFKVPILNCTS